MSTITTVEPTSAKAPVLTEGDISPAVMMDFENATLNFFVSKSIASEKQVTMIIPGIKDLRICDCISAEHGHLVKLPFVDFMKGMRSNYLHQDLLRLLIVTGIVSLSSFSGFEFVRSTTSSLLDTVIL